MSADSPGGNAGPAPFPTEPTSEPGPPRGFASHVRQLVAAPLSPRRLPVTRDQLMLVMVALNELFLALDVYLAHGANGTIVPNEWHPIYFGLCSGLLLILAGSLATRHRTLASTIATAALLGSVFIGFLGVYFHLDRAILPTAPQGQRLTLDLLIWAPPVMGPLAFALVGLLGISAAWEELPAGSGRLKIFRELSVHLPYSKTRAYVFTIGMGMLAALVSSVLDHARAGFANPWLWFAVATGVFGTVVPVVFASLEKPSRLDLYTYAAAMLLLLITGAIGTSLHVQANLVFEYTIVLERFLRGAPPLAPLLFANMGLLGLLALLDPEYVRV